MSSSLFTRAAGASVSALALALGAPAALAQEALPTIDVGAAATPNPAAAPGAAGPLPAVSSQSSPDVVDNPRPGAHPDVTASSEREYSEKQVTQRIYSQPGEALEIVPGLIVAQHSGVGKANQYFLRGFALDHGYDIGITLDGMNVNQPSHVHSNGYADTNMLIPELLSGVDVRKGPYFADEGVFSSVGAVHMQYVDSLRDGLIIASGGSFAWGRTVMAKSWGVGEGELLMALEGNIYNGPWERPDEERKINGVARWSAGTEDNGYAITGMAYSNHYFATDQIPNHLVWLGLMSRWGTQDPTDGGNASRYSLSARWSETTKEQWSRVEAYFIHNDTNLYDNFTYQLSNPVTAGGLGDQTHQFDHRNQIGMKAQHGWNYNLASFPTETRVGTDNLFDFIHNGNGDSSQRIQYDQIADNYIKEYIQALWTDTTLKWTPWMRSTAGFRLDYVHGSVNSEANPIAAQGWLNGTPFYLGSYNNGELGRFFTSPKFGTVFGPFYNTEFFLNYGEGLRAEDMRAATNHFATDGTQYTYIPNVQLLTKTRGAEGGFRAKLFDGFETDLSLFWQHMDAEQEFNADSATSVYGRPGRRYGFEWTTKYDPVSWLHFDSEVTGTHARFQGFDTIQAATLASYLSGGPGSDGGLWPMGLRGLSPGNFLSLAPVWVATAGLEIGEKTGWFSGLQYRYFGARPLTEDGQISSPATGTVNARLGYRFDNGWKVQLDGFNITNSRSDMIDYQANMFGKQDFLLFPRYAGGSAYGISGRVFKPIDPPAVRITLSGPIAWGEATPITSKN